MGHTDNVPSKAPNDSKLEHEVGQIVRLSSGVQAINSSIDRRGSVIVFMACVYKNICGGYYGAIIWATFSDLTSYHLGHLFWGKWCVSENAMTLGFQHMFAEQVLLTCESSIAII